MATTTYDFATVVTTIDPDRLVALRTHLKEHERTFVLSPTLWSKWKGAPSLTWSYVDFDASEKDKIPESRGLYCFLASPVTASAIPTISYPLYVGETGDTSQSHLRKRFGEYLYEAKKLKRAKFLVAFTQLKGHLRFAYAAVADTSVRLRDLEALLTDALGPPLSEDDYSAELRQARSAF